MKTQKVNKYLQIISNSRIEVTLVVITLVLGICRFFHVPYSIELLVVSLSLLSKWYMFFGFIIFNNIDIKDIAKGSSYKNISTKKMIGSVATGLAVGIALAGVSLKIEHFPGAIFLAVIGLFGITVISIISLVKKRSAIGKYYLNVLKRSLAVGMTTLTHK